jgi:hypothetical protein
MWELQNNKLSCSTRPTGTQSPVQSTNIITLNDFIAETHTWFLAPWYSASSAAVACRSPHGPGLWAALTVGGWRRRYVTNMWFHQPKAVWLHLGPGLVSICLVMPTGPTCMDRCCGMVALKSTCWTQPDGQPFSNSNHCNNRPPNMAPGCGKDVHACMS